MIVAKAPPQPEQQQPELPQPERRVLLRDVSWEMYQSLRLIEQNYHLRMTYDRGLLEIMSPSRKHERVSYLIGRMIDEWTMHHDIDIGAGRNTTFNRKDLDRGLEPDNCYWITHEPDIRDREEFDLAIDPPPDLAIEVDVSRLSISKLPIYASLGVPEIWRWRYEALEILRLNEQSEYVIQQASLELPRFPIAQATSLLQDREGKSDTKVVKSFVRLIKSRR
jgi:Uma2 family endonuclease